MTALILSHQRCGSSNLLRFLRFTYDLRGSLEALNVKNLNKEQPGWRSMTEKDFTAYAGQVLGSFDVVKHIVGEHPPAFDRLIAGHEKVDRVIVLYRRNVAAAALSSLAARRMKNFNVAPGAPLGPISLKDIEKRCRELKKQIRLMEQIIKDYDKRSIFLRYEDIYDTSYVACIKKISRLEEHLNLVPSGRLDEGYQIYLSKKNKINTETTYRYIANFDEILQNFPDLSCYRSSSSLAVILRFSRNLYRLLRVQALTR